MRLLSALLCPCRMRLLLLLNRENKKNSKHGLHMRVILAAWCAPLAARVCACERAGHRR